MLQGISSSRRLRGADKREHRTKLGVVVSVGDVPVVLPLQSQIQIVRFDFRSLSEERGNAQCQA